MSNGQVDEERIEEKLMFRDTQGDPVAFELLGKSVELTFHMEDQDEATKALMYFDKRHIKHVRWLLQALEELED